MGFRAAVTALCLIVSTAAPAAAAACYSDQQARADKVRQLQTELMVAALKCRHWDGELAVKYESFVRKFGGNLIDNAKVLRNYHGSRFDAYITTLANAASIRSAKADNYCASMTPVFDDVLAVKKTELEDFAARSFDGSPVQTCTAAKAAPAKAAKVAKSSDAKAETVKR